MNKEIPPLVLSTSVVYGIIYRFFAPWYVRLWRRVKRHVAGDRGQES